MMAPLRSFAEGVPHGRYHSAHPSGGPLAFGVGGSPQAQHSGTYRYLLPSAPRSCPFLWSWRGGSAPGDSRLSSCPLYGGGTLGGARGAPLAPRWPGTRVAERLSPRTDSRGAVCCAAQPGVWCHRTQRPGSLCPLDTMAPSGYDDDHPVWGL